MPWVRPWDRAQSQEDVAKTNVSKRPHDDAEPIFGPNGWLDHSGLFQKVDVHVEHAGAEPYARGIVAAT